MQCTVWSHIYSTCALENTTHQRPCHPLKGHIWVRIHQESWKMSVDPDQIYNPFPLCLPHAYLFRAWKLTSVASVTRQNGFCLVKVRLWLVLSVYHIILLLAACSCSRSEAKPIKRSWKMHWWKWTQHYNIMSPFQPKSLKMLLRLWDKEG